MKIKAYLLYDRAVALQPAPSVSEYGQENAASSATLAWPGANGQRWNLLCPTTFPATWNGGPRAEDIEICWEATRADQISSEAAFVQSNLGEGRLTFYPGYQFKTASENVLWLRGPLNMPKDGLAPLEELVDASILPCTVTIQWQFTRPHQTIHFAAGESFGTLLLYPKTGLEGGKVEVLAAANASF